MPSATKFLRKIDALGAVNDDRQLLWTVRLAALALADFREIIDWTLQRFGEKQARVYALRKPECVDRWSYGETNSQIRADDAELQQCVHRTPYSERCKARHENAARHRDQPVAKPIHYRLETLMQNPPHPGDVLLDTVLRPDGGMTVAEFAKHLCVSRLALSRVVNRKTAVSAELAIRLAAALPGFAESWLRMQIAYDLWHAQKMRRAKIEPLDANTVAR